MKQVGQREQTLLPEARMKAPMEAARPTHTVETSDLTYRMVSNTAMPVALSASKSQACQCTLTSTACTVDRHAKRLDTNLGVRLGVSARADLTGC